MLRMATARRFLSIQCFNSHHAHKPCYVATTNSIALQRQLIPEHPCAHKGVLRVQSIDVAHESKIELRRPFGFVVNRASRNIQECSFRDRSRFLKNQSPTPAGQSSRATPSDREPRLPADFRRTQRWHCRATALSIARSNSDEPRNASQAPR